MAHELLADIDRDKDLDIVIGGIWYDGLPLEEIALLVGGEGLQAMGFTLDELAQEVARLRRADETGLQV